MTSPETLWKVIAALDRADGSTAGLTAKQWDAIILEARRRAMGIVGEI